MEPPKPKYLTPRDLARRFLVSERQICKLARTGYLPAIKFGKLWRFREDAIEEWERSHTPENDLENLANQIINGG